MVGEQEWQEDQSITIRLQLEQQAKNNFPNGFHFQLCSAAETMLVGKQLSNNHSSSLDFA